MRVQDKLANRVRAKAVGFVPFPFKEGLGLSGSPAQCFVSTSMGEMSALRATERVLPHAVNLPPRPEGEAFGRSGPKGEGYSRLLAAFFLSLLPLLALACGAEGPRALAEGNDAYAKADYTAALESYNTASDLLPDRAEPAFDKGNAYYRQEGYRSAQREYEDALVKSPGAPLSQSAHYNLGNAYFHRERYDVAADEYKEALRLDPNDADAKYNLELTLKRLQEQQQQQQEQPQQGQDGDQPREPQPGDGQQQPQQGNGGQEEQPSQPQPQRGQEQAMTPDQARQLVEAVGQNTQTLQQALQQQYRVTRQSGQDW